MLKMKSGRLQKIQQSGTDETNSALDIPSKSFGIHNGLLAKHIGCYISIPSRGSSLQKKNTVRRPRLGIISGTGPAANTPRKPGITTGTGMAGIMARPNRETTQHTNWMWPAGLWMLTFLIKWRWKQPNVIL